MNRKFNNLKTIHINYWMNQSNSFTIFFSSTVIGIEDQTSITSKLNILLAKLVLVDYYCLNDGCDIYY